MPADTPTRPFWETKTLAEMTEAEWESLCDGCGQCCLHKLEDADTGEFYITDYACRLLDCETGRCRDYANRFAHVPDCVQLSPKTVLETAWLPETCAYRLIADGQPLAWWHPLVSGDPDTVRQAGLSVAGHVEADDPTPARMARRIRSKMAGVKPGRGG
jgi:uncharacterized cysteine cluster protein YcgN (CxxCxxCC family)